MFKIGEVFRAEEGPAPLIVITSDRMSPDGKILDDGWYLSLLE